MSILEYSSVVISIYLPMHTSAQKMRMQWKCNSFIIAKYRSSVTAENENTDTAVGELGREMIVKLVL